MDGETLDMSMGMKAPQQPLGDDDPAVYRSDEFRMFCFKVLRCSKRYPHDWMSCPFAHPSEKAKRRHPLCHTGIACPAMKTNFQCPRGDSCKFAHNVFEYWLHPTRYHTQLCNDGINCSRGICFFAHTLEELRDSSPAMSNKALKQYIASGHRHPPGVGTSDGLFLPPHAARGASYSGQLAGQQVGQQAGQHHHRGAGGSQSAAQLEIARSSPAPLPAPPRSYSLDAGSMRQQQHQQRDAISASFMGTQRGPPQHQQYGSLGPYLNSHAVPFDPRQQQWQQPFPQQQYQTVAVAHPPHAAVAATMAGLVGRPPLPSQAASDARIQGLATSLANLQVAGGANDNTMAEADLFQAYLMQQQEAGGQQYMQYQPATQQPDLYHTYGQDAHTIVPHMVPFDTAARLPLSQPLGGQVVGHHVIHDTMRGLPHSASLQQRRSPQGADDSSAQRARSQHRVEWRRASEPCLNLRPPLVTGGDMLPTYLSAPFHATAHVLPEARPPVGHYVMVRSADTAMVGQHGGGGDAAAPLAAYLAATQAQQVPPGGQSPIVPWTIGPDPGHGAVRQPGRSGAPSSATSGGSSGGGGGSSGLVEGQQAEMRRDSFESVISSSRNVLPPVPEDEGGWDTQAL